jgi:surface antigen
MFQEPVSVPPTLASHEDLPTTPLPATHSQFEQKETAVLPAQVTPVPATHSQLEQKETAVLPAQVTPVPAMLTRQLGSPKVTRQLSLTGSRSLSSVGAMLSQAGISAEGTEGGAPRTPVVIKGEMKKRVSPQISARSHMKRRLLVTVSGVLIFFLVASFALLLASPLGQTIGLTFNVPSNGGNLITGNNGNLNLIAQATATAVSYQHNDGYDPYSNGGVTISDGSGSLNWPVGQCTYWANYRYHELTGNWVSWTGNADQWVAGARAAGWHVSTSPHVPSIIVLMPYVQGAYGYGHVAVVESEDDNASPVVVHTSNMNWFNGGGGWDKESDYDFTVGPGVYFVWK